MMRWEFSNYAFLGGHHWIGQMKRLQQIKQAVVISRLPADVKFLELFSSLERSTIEVHPNRS